MKIVWQNGLPWYLGSKFEKGVEEYVNSIKRPDVEVVFWGVERVFYPEGRVFDFNRLLAATAPGGVLHKVVQAEREGYDAVIIADRLDPVLYEARSIVDIPVLGISETAMLVSCMLGKKFGIIAWRSKFLEMFERLVRTYGMENRMACIEDMRLEDAEMLYKGLEEPGNVIQLFTACARKAVDSGAEVIIPGSSLLDLILGKNGIVEIDGSLVLNSITTVVKITEAMVDMRKAGIKVSRRLLYSSLPKESIRECLDLFGLT